MTLTTTFPSDNTSVPTFTDDNHGKAKTMNVTAVVQTTIWAIVVFALALIVINKFATPFRAMVERLKRLGPAEFDANPPAQLQTEAKKESPLTSTELVRVVPGSVLAERVEIAREAIRSLQPEQREEQAIRLAAFMALWANLEALNYQIYGSQLALLQTLNSRTVSIAEAQSYYESAAGHSPEQYREYPFERWLGWLVNTAQLAVRSGDTLSISSLGREFLKHLVERGYPMQRYL